LKLRQFILVLIVAAGIWAYHNSFQGPFILDDVGSILKNSTIYHLWPIWKALSPSPTSLVGGRPVVNLSLALNYALGGTGVWGYHAVNLAIHVLAGLTLYGIVRRTLLRTPRSGDRRRTGAQEEFGSSRALLATSGTSAEWVALAVALLWTVHPLQTEAVTYVSQRCESLMGLFYLLTLYCFIRGVEGASERVSVERGASHGTAGGRDACPTTVAGGWFCVSVAACFLGMASKEVMVTAPVMVLLYDRTFVSGSFREAWSRHRRLYLGLAGSWLLLGYLMAGLHNRSVGYGLGSTWWGYALAECRAVVQYLRLALWPHPLIFDYGLYVPTKEVVAVAPYAPILAVLATSVLFSLKRHPAIGFVGAWFFVILAPTSSVVPIVGSPIAEHRMYLPLASVVTLIVLGAIALGKRLFQDRPGIVVGCMTGAAVAGLLSSLTIHRHQDYHSALTIWQDTVEKRPNNPRAHNNLGVALLRQGHVQDAIGNFERALQIKPGDANAHYNLGLALVQLGRLPEAIQQYHRALRINPDYADAHNDLGIALQQTGKIEEAIAHYEQALRLNPDFVDAENNLAVTLAREGRVPEAITHWEQALRINPDYAEADYNLGLALTGLGKLPEAIEHYEHALRINPDYAEARNNLGAALMRQGRLPEAIGCYEQALRINPDYAEAEYNLGAALEQAGRVQEAIAHYNKALRLQPDLGQARDALAHARAAQ
jgi:tetratricopeptide (TPR) repeat protein